VASVQVRTVRAVQREQPHFFLDGDAATLPRKKNETSLSINIENTKLKSRLTVYNGTPQVMSSSSKNEISLRIYTLFTCLLSSKAMITDSS
jgi:hypothetical protein